MDKNKRITAYKRNPKRVCACAQTVMRHALDENTHLNQPN
jgi:hypothetical protein